MSTFTYSKYCPLARTHRAAADILASAVWLAAAALLATACGLPKRDNPADPDVADSGRGIELVASLPVDGTLKSALLSDIRYTISAADIRTPLSGEMNLVGERASAFVRGITPGPARVFQVDVFDVNRIRTLAAVDTVDVDEGVPEIVLLRLIRLTGTIELTSNLPPEVVTLDVAVGADGDSLGFTFESSGPVQVRMNSVPTGTDIRVAMRGRDVDGQILVAKDLLADVRAELVARVGLPTEIGALQVLAHFPGYIPLAPVDRFSDAAGTFFRRTESPNLPGTDEAIDFDRNFLFIGFGPDGETVEHYHFDSQSPTPAPLYILVDSRGEAIAGQLPLFDDLPGDEAYSDIHQLLEVSVTDRSYRPNAITSFADVQAAGYEIVPTLAVMNCVIVPDGSTASKRIDAGAQGVLFSGWYRDQVVRYFSFENPQSSATIEFGGGQITTPLMYGFFENDRDVIDGFTIDRDTGITHNVATRLPGTEGYSPLWALQIFTLGAFERVANVPSAQDQAKNEENLIVLDSVLLVNAPIVTVE